MILLFECLCNIFSNVYYMSVLLFFIRGIMQYTFISWYRWSLEHLAQEIGNLDYDVTVELFSILSDEFCDDSQLHREENYHQTGQKIMKHIGVNLQKTITNNIIPLADMCREHNTLSQEHHKSIENYPYSLNVLWSNIRDLTYHSLFDLFILLSEKFTKDSLADYQRWRPVIAWWLASIWKSLEKIAHQDIKELLILTRMT